MRIKLTILLIVAFSLMIAACVTKGTQQGELHRWWSGLGPVLPHDDFPANCKLCHLGESWDVLVDNFEFDHARRTGVKLSGAHAQAQCLRCHNDRGPVAVFKSKGCIGCHEDFHKGDLGKDCRQCHTEQTWRPVGMIEMHNSTRFPLMGAHANTSCYRCHPAGRAGVFTPTDTECVTCHQDDLDNTANPPHLGLGWVDRCDRCHMPTRWEQATVQQQAQRR